MNGTNLAIDCAICCVLGGFYRTAKVFTKLEMTCIRLGPDCTVICTHCSLHAAGTSFIVHIWVEVSVRTNRRRETPARAAHCAEKKMLWAHAFHFCLRKNPKNSMDSL